LPYVKKVYRDQIDQALQDVEENGAFAQPGVLAYVVYRLMKRASTDEDGLATSFDAIAKASGAVTEAVAEWRRRIVVPYEVKKRTENGEIEP
jgi:hypothetical protein